MLNVIGCFVVFQAVHKTEIHVESDWLLLLSSFWACFIRWGSHENLGCFDFCVLLSLLHKMFGSLLLAVFCTWLVYCSWGVSTHSCVQRSKVNLAESQLLPTQLLHLCTHGFQSATEMEPSFGHFTIEEHQQQFNLQIIFEQQESGMRWTCYLNGGYLVGDDVGGGSWVPLDFMLLLLLLLEPWWFLRSTMPLGSFCAALCCARTPWLLCGASDCPADCETSRSQPTAFVLITGLLGKSRGLLLLLSFLKCPTEGWVDIPCNWVDISSAMYVLTPPLSSSMQELLLSLTNSIAFACCQPCVISLDNLKSQFLPPWTLHL